MTATVTLDEVTEIRLLSPRPVLTLILGGISLERTTGMVATNVGAVRPVGQWTSSRGFDAGLTASEPQKVESEKAPAVALSEVVKWLHSESGLTWEQIAKLFGVSRRTVHLWASGGSMNSRHFSLLSEVMQIVRGLPVRTPKQRRELLLLPGRQGRTLYDSIRDHLASDYIEANYDDISAAVNEALAQLDGSVSSALSVITGLTAEEIEDLGGLP